MFTDSNLEEKTIKTTEIFSGKIINVAYDKVMLSNGRTASREVVNHPGGVCVAALTKENELLFVKQYRYPYKEVVLELPAGKLEKGSDPLENGKRELREETGAVGEKYVYLGKLYPSPGYCGEIIYMYFCKILEFKSTNPDEDELIELEKIPLKIAVEMVLRNEIPDAKSQVAILKVNELLKDEVL